MADNKNVKVDPKKVKKEDFISGIFQRTWKT